MAATANEQLEARLTVLTVDDVIKLALPAGTNDSQIRVIRLAQNQIAGGPSERPNLCQLLRRLMSLFDV